MKVTIILTGKTEEAYLEQGIQKYSDRLKHFMKLEWRILPPVKHAASLSSEELKKREGELFLSQLSPSDFSIVLDEKGKEFTSIEFADFLNMKKNSGVKILFFIGGAYGVSEEVKKAADFQLSLSKMTFTHQMIRLIFAEQLYRAFSIISGSKYHHS
jgi:23S rRNA (pseudouridine1915-N3)-methyltransferase